MLNIKNTKIGSIILIFLFSVMLITTGCDNAADSGSKPNPKPPVPPKKYTVKFEKESGNGTLTAKIKNGGTITDGATVDEQTTIVFTAMPATTGNGFYIEGWEINPAGLNFTVAPDKKTAELIVTENATVKVKFKEYTVLNANWEASGKINASKSGTGMKEHHLRFVISDTNVLTIFDIENGNSSSVTGMVYDESAKTISLKAPSTGTIKITPKPGTLPADWTADFTNVKVGDWDIQDGDVTLRVTRNTDDFIK